MSLFQITEDIETIVKNTIFTGIGQELIDKRNGSNGDPAVWLTTNWQKYDDGWYIIVTNRYCDTGNRICDFVIHETHMSNKEYEEYKKTIEEKGYAPLEKFIKE